MQISQSPVNLTTQPESVKSSCSIRFQWLFKLCHAQSLFIMSLLFYINILLYNQSLCFPQTEWACLCFNIFCWAHKLLRGFFLCSFILNHGFHKEKGWQLSVLNTAAEFIHVLPCTWPSPPCHISLFHDSQQTVRLVRRQSLGCSVSEVGKTPRFWPATVVWAGLAHYSRDVLK